MMQVTKQNTGSSLWQPLEKGQVVAGSAGLARVRVADALGRVYVDSKASAGKALRFRARGLAGLHTVSALDGDGAVLAEQRFTLQPATSLHCSKGPYAELANALATMMTAHGHGHDFVVDGKAYHLLICWSRDHVYTLKAMKYYLADVKSGMEFYLDRPRPDGSFWDDIYPNREAPAPTWFGEALGEGFFTYSQDRRWVIRRVPVLADVEFVVTEGVWYAWKASGDDAWMAAALPLLDKALEYNTSSPICWSDKHGLVRRSFCMDGWDFANALYCKGDHRVLHEGDPQFLFHGDNSGLYSIYWRLAEMHQAAGHADRAAELREQGEAFRQRANDKLFFDTNYGHMIPETLPEEQVYAQVGDERKRMSLSTGYTLTRRLATHELAVATLKEYQRRLKANRAESFAEWWSMDPPYTLEQWPSHGPPIGEYMNGGICPIVAGELAKAAFDHGLEDYGADILRRTWQVAQDDGGHLHQVYRRLPTTTPPPVTASFTPVDLRPLASVGLRNGAHRDVPAWTGEGDNDMRNLPTGRRKFGAIEFDVIDPKANAGRSIVKLGGDWVTVPVGHQTGQAVYFMHAAPFGTAGGAVLGYYDVCYADGVEQRIHVRNGHEVGLWWGIGPGAVDRSTTRIAWQGANGQWKNVGLYMFGWNNPRPDVPITAIRCRAIVQGPPPSDFEKHLPPPRCGLMLAAISLSDSPVKYEESIRSYGLPDSWSQAAVYYAVAEGLAGIEDGGRAFDVARVSPRWAATESDRAAITLHYPASDGYCSYEYRLDAKKHRITLELTGSFRRAELHCLLPAGAKPARVEVDGQDVPFQAVKIEKSTYADFTLEQLPAGPVVIEYK